jgi:hypothetical protein
MRSTRMPSGPTSTSLTVGITPRFAGERRGTTGSREQGQAMVLRAGRLAGDRSARAPTVNMGAIMRHLRRGMTPLIIGWLIVVIAFVALLEIAD